MNWLIPPNVGVIAMLTTSLFAGDDLSFGVVAPALIGTALFFYLWWLAALIFYLGFVWQRYERRPMFEQHPDDWSEIE